MSGYPTLSYYRGRAGPAGRPDRRGCRRSGLGLRSYGPQFLAAPGDRSVPEAGQDSVDPLAPAECTSSASRPTRTGIAWRSRPANRIPDLGERTGQFRFLIRDRDTKYTNHFDEVFTSEGIEVLRSPPQAPRANVYAERWVRTVRRECLDRMLIYGPRHLLAVLAEFVVHDNEHRSHQSRDQRPPAATDAPAAVVDLASARVRRRKILNGLISEYSQAAQPEPRFRAVQTSAITPQVRARPYQNAARRRCSTSSAPGSQPVFRRSSRQT
jgi:hypothetical protein